MPSNNTIFYLEHRELDKQLWDRCIDNADNGLIYAYSFYLDQMADCWDALVLGNYEAVMPLPWRKKFFVCYLYQPFLIAQLGVFGKKISAALLQNFLEKVPYKFKYWDLSFNYQNIFAIPEFNLFERTNYVLNLNLSYAVLYKNYRENSKRNIKKAMQNGCFAATDIGVEEVIELAKQQTKVITETDFKNFSILYKKLKDKGSAKAYGIHSRQNQLLASAVFLFSNKRAYYILVGNHPDGRITGASHALIDSFIKEHAEQNLLLDFEGSDIRNLAFFYSGFGATEEKYSAIKLNKLPWYLKWLKN